MQENWINKIIEHHTTPPEAVWNNISGELNKEEESLNTVKLKLLAYETAAPKIVFKNVFDQLDKDDSKIHAITEKKQNRVTIFIKMAAAASVITIAILLFFNNTKKVDTEKTAVTTITNQPAIKQPGAGIAAVTNLPVTNTNKKRDGQKIADIPVQKTNSLQAAVHYHKAGGSVIEELKWPRYPNNTGKPQSMQQIMPVSIALINALKRYVTITGPGGESVRISSKLGNMLGVLNDGNTDSEENIDAIIKESSKWSNVFAGWRDKMAGNVIAPSLINFLDIIELSEFLEEKKQTISRLDLYYLNLY